MTLIGPNPDMDVPALPTPWTTRGAQVLDANGVHVLTVSPNEGFPADRCDVADAVADTMNRAHGQQGDAVWRDDA